MLWVALHLPRLSMETLVASDPTLGDGDLDPPPLALTDGHQILQVDAAARALGVAPGQKRATALALAPRLTLAQADAARDAQALQAVAHAALAFTPAVALAPPRTVLLEVRASLRCFGGQDRLMQRLRAALAPLGHHVRLASAPTAQGAALLARLARGGGPAHDLHCADLAELTQRLEAAPVWLLGPGREHWDALQGMGLRTVRDLRSLPRSGLARRFGEPLLNELDRAFGRRPDPRRPVEPPPSFDSRIELLARADTTEQVLRGAQVLLVRLIAWAQARQVRIVRLQLRMVHERRHRSELQSLAPTELEIALAQPSCDAAHLQLLLRERLAHLPLPAPTLELQLTCTDVVHRPPPNGELFLNRQDDREGLVRLIERLQARLGREQVQRLVHVEDHRPERASRCAALDPSRPFPPPRPPAPAATATALRLPLKLKDGKAYAEPLDLGDFDDDEDHGEDDGEGHDDRTGPRIVRHDGRKPTPPVGSAPAEATRVPAAAAPVTQPVWLLPDPLPLTEHERHPMLDGRPLTLLCGPERVESGWWDGALAARDYFIARADDDALVWVYRRRLPTGGGDEPVWFVQGWFG